MTSKQIREDREQYIRLHYLNKTYTEISVDLGISKSQVCNIALNKLGLSIGKGNRKTEERKYIANDDLYDVWTRDNTYILGFLVSDGFLSNRKGRIGFGLSKKDIKHLSNIRDIISPYSPIREYLVGVHECCELRFTSHKICNFLESIGITYQKTGNEPLLLDIIPTEYHYDYLRGIIDGDGCIYVKNRIRTINNRKYISKDRRLSIICKNDLFLLDIKNRLCDNYGRIYKQYNYYVYETSDKNNVINICNKIYSNLEGQLFLDRKYQKFLNILKD